MAIQDLFKGNAIAVVAVGVAAAVLIPVVLPAVARAGKPFAKGLIKGGLIMYERGRETVAELSEVLEDVMAEARAEIEQEHAAAITPAPPPEPGPTPAQN